MNEYPNLIKSTLQECIDDLASYSYLYSENPHKNFTRKRKLGFAKTIAATLAMQKSTLAHELLNFFDYSDNSPTPSAFCQQRNKITPEAFLTLFEDFSEKISREHTYKGLKLLAVDGSDVNIPRNSSDQDTYIEPKDATGHNVVHLNASFDLLNRVYTQAIVQPIHSANETDAMCAMVDSNPDCKNTLYLADRGYVSWNVLGHLIHNGALFLLRSKAPSSSGSILANFKLSDEQDEFDLEAGKFLTRRQTQNIQSNPELYKRLKAINFDYLPHGSKNLFCVKFRIVKIKLKEPNEDGELFEYILTNLNSYLFPLEEIRKLYHMRWGIETSFRQLKYHVGMIYFHSRKYSLILQEIYSSLIMFDFCQAITAHVAHKDLGKKHVQQTNAAQAIRICMEFYKRVKTNVINVEKLIGRYLQPVRPDRHFKRKMRGQTAEFFVYR